MAAQEPQTGAGAAAADGHSTADSTHTAAISRPTRHMTVMLSRDVAQVFPWDPTVTGPLPRVGLDGQQRVPGGGTVTSRR